MSRTENSPTLLGGTSPARSDSSPSFGATDRGSLLDAARGELLVQAPARPPTVHSISSVDYRAHSQPGFVRDNGTAWPGEVNRTGTLTEGGAVQFMNQLIRTHGGGGTVTIVQNGRTTTLTLPNEPITLPLNNETRDNLVNNHGLDRLRRIDFVARQTMDGDRVTGATVRPPERTTVSYSVPAPRDS